MQLQSILIVLAATTTPIFALPIVPQHIGVGVESIELHNIHQESCQQLGQSIQAVVKNKESTACDRICQKESDKTLAILKSAQKDFPC